MKKFISAMLLTLLLGMNFSFAAKLDYGSFGALEKEEYTLEEMLNYAIEDEYLAKAEYESIMEEYGEIRPFTNIMKAEETHIKLLKPLFEKYDIKIPNEETSDYIIKVSSLKETFKVGAEAEINNIAMYEKFLQMDLEDDVKDVFVKLMEASKNHLEAFEKNLNRLESGNLDSLKQNKKSNTDDLTQRKNLKRRDDKQNTRKRR